ncbi:MAG TPA: ATP-binding protein [Natronosporangium sp.]|nr:ATP-binding protein [Natronosporangium sp.]
MSTPVAERRWTVVVPHHARGARLARERLTAELADKVPPSLLADAVAVLGELVGNAVCHAEPLPGGVVRVAWWLRLVDGDTVAVRIGVTDGGALNRSPALRAVGPEAVDGRGLRIVRALSTRWGVDRDGLGQTVWAELSPASPGLPPA